MNAMTATKPTVTAKSKRKTWIVALCNSEGDDIFTELVTGTKAQVKDYLVKMLKAERKDYKENDDWDWDYGTTSAREVNEDPREILSACGVWSTFHITVSARPASLTPTKHLGNPKRKGA